MENKEIRKNKKKRTLFHRIINVFLYICLGIFIILVFAFGFSQTSTFRNYLKGFVIAQADSALNGTVSIGNLEGTIFTSLILRNTIVNMGKDTLLNAGTISIKTSPLQLLFKKIYVRNFEIRDASILLKKDSSGELNISKLFPASTVKDTSKSSFPFNIYVAKFNLINISFGLQSYRNNSKEIYDTLNIDNLHVKNLNLSLSLYADINNNDFRVQIDKFYASPNISSFILNNLTGQFHVNEKGIFVNNLNVNAGGSIFSLKSKIENFNLFDSTSSFQSAGINLHLQTDSLNFSTLSTFIPSLNILKGKVVSDIRLSGNLKRMNIDQLEIRYDSTQLKTKGEIKNLDKPLDMYITASFYDSYVNQSDINKLLPSLQVPIYPQLGLLTFDTLTYKGKPENFTSSFFMKTNKGNLSAKANLNLQNPKLAYSIALRTWNLDISPFAGINTNLNSICKITGSGTSPQNLNASVEFIADGSLVKGFKLDSLRLNAAAESKNIKYNFAASSDTMGISLNGNLDFTKENPSYKLKGDVKDFNAAFLSSDTSMNTSLNFNLAAEGENFEPDKINLYLSFRLFNSSINEIHIDSTRAIVDLRSNDKGLRVVNIVSDLADITLTGNFSIMSAVNLAGSEAGLISNYVKNKTDRLFPSQGTIEQKSLGTVKNFVSSGSSMNIQYLIDLKNFELISLFLGSNQLEVDGEITGDIKNNNDSLNISLNTMLNYVKFWGKDDVFFLSNFNLNFNLKNQLNAMSTENVYAGLHLKTDRIFAGTDVKNLKFDLDLNGDEGKIYFSSILENYASALVAGNLNFNGNTLNLLLDTLGLKYNQVSFLNRGKVNLAYANDRIDINNFFLKRVNGPGEIEINGKLVQSGNQDLKISFRDFAGSDLSANLLNLKSGESIAGNLNLNSEIKGNFQNPLINLNLNLDSITYKNQDLGSLKGKLNYKDKNLAADIRFADSSKNYQNPNLLISGNLPVDLGLKGVEKRLIKNQPVNLKFNAKNFNLAAFANSVSQLKQLSGTLNADIDITGDYENLATQGTLVVQNADFIAAANNLEYYAGVKLSIDQSNLSIDSLVIENSKGTENGGRMTGSGKAVLDNLDVKSSQFQINGKLKVLSNASQDASPTVYGDLVIATNGNVQFSMDKNRAYLEAPITVTSASLTFPPAPAGYQNNLQSYIYKFAADTAKKDTQNLSFENLVKLSQQRSSAKNINSSNAFNFDYKIDVNVENEAKIIFILSKELNQKLTAVLKGNFQYERNEGVPNAQGELSLLEGSNLQFFKTLTAEGSIKFESELDNPNLDITATYSGYYYPNSSSSTDSSSSIEPVSPEEKVAVKIKIQGALKQLNKNFIQEKNNIAVYIGQTAIDNDEPDPRLDASDAVYFIITGDFLNPAYNKSPNTPIGESTTTSLAGSILGGFLNSYLGDYVRSVQVRKVGTQTKVNLSGRVKDFRYSIGGSTDVFQDITQANVMIEYPIIKSLLVRLERKEAINQTGLQNEMINELGLKYKFEF